MTLQLNSTSESEIKPIIESIVTDLVNAVHINESIMSENEDNDDLDITSYYEAMEETLCNRDFNECPNEANVSTITGEPLSLPPNRGKQIQDAMALSETIDNENDYTPKRTTGSDWKYSSNSQPKNDYSDPNTVGSKYKDILDSWNQSKEDNRDRNRPVRNDYSPKRSAGSPTHQRSSTLPDWKNSSNNYQSNDYSELYKNIGSKYDNLIDSWSKEDRPKANPTRVSVIRNFDPLFGRDSNFPSPPERRKTKQRTDKNIREDIFRRDLNDSTGLVDCFANFKIEETPEKLINITITDPTPDVLEFAVQKQEEEDNKTEELKKRITELEEQLKQKDIKLEEEVNHRVAKLEEVVNQRVVELEEEIKQKDLKLNQTAQLLDKISNENKIVFGLINSLHDINQKLFETSEEKIQSLKQQLSDASKERDEMEMKAIETEINFKKLTDEFSSIQMTKSANENQYLIAIERIKQLERESNQLIAKNTSLEQQICSNEGKNDLENELIANRVQIKRMEMKIKSLENHLDQKNKENTELSSMVDDLIIKVKN